ncbi:MAG: B12-binding domain-containing radical SAM protein, partial [Phycisphaerae bacterium]
MRVLLITSTRKDLVNVWVCQETSPAGSLLPPVDLASLAAVVRAQGHEASICDLRLARSPARAYRSALERFRPDAVVLNLATTGAEDDFALIKTTPDSIKRVCFGTHAQSLPQEVFAEGFDYILLGDPEAGLVNLLTHALDGQAAEGVLTPDRLTQKAALWEDLDTMPFPALDLLDLGRYRSSMVRRGKRFTLLMGSRGCPYSCTYCLYPVLLGSDSRLRSVKSICDEIEEDVRSHGIRSFYFLDATFNIKIGRAEAFAEELLSRNLKIDWSCNMRVAPVSREMLRLLKRSGCDWILYGVEDQDFLVETKKATTKDATLEAFRLTREAGISTIAFTMIFARPGLSEQRYAREMLRVLRLLEADAFQCNIAIPFPGTEMYQIEEAKGSPSRRWSLYDPHGAQLPYETEI